RAVPHRPRLPAGAAGAGVDREPQARAAQGPAHPGAAGLLGALRRAHRAGRGRGQGRLPGAGAAGDAGPAARARQGGGERIMSPTLHLFAGVAGVLILASAVGALLKWRVAHGAPHAVIDNLNARVNAWWVMVAVIGLAFAFGKGGVIVLFYLISFYALREFMSLTYTRRGDHLAMAAAFYIALPVQYFLVWIEWYGMFAIFIPVEVFLILPILSALGGDTKRFLERTPKVQWGLMVCVFCISHVPALLTLHIPGF